MIGPTLAEIEETHARLASQVVRTPTIPLPNGMVSSILGGQVVLKLELFQHTGTFKLRGALNNLANIDLQGRGVTAVSAGNHAVAVAYAASKLKVDAKIVIMSSANKARRKLAESFGAELVVCDTPALAFQMMEELVATEDRVAIHPFDGPNVATATAGVGYELVKDTGPFDAVVVAIGGGGLSGGVSCAVKRLLPQCQVYGVEPIGANSMQQSLTQGHALTGLEVNTIADSLGPPLTLDYPVAMCREFVDEVVTVSDDELCRAIYLLFTDVKLAVEPAGAAALAAAIGPLRKRLQGKRVGLIVCGTCLDVDNFSEYLKRGENV